jgi:hypothetical protein
MLISVTFKFTGTGSELVVLIVVVVVIVNYRVLYYGMLDGCTANRTRP